MTLLEISAVISLAGKLTFFPFQTWSITGGTDEAAVLLVPPNGECPGLRHPGGEWS